MYFSGEPGTLYDVQLYNSDTQELSEVQGTIQPTWDDTVVAPVSNAGHYKYLGMRIRRPTDVAWQYLSLRDTPTAMANRLATTIESALPPPMSGFAFYSLLAASFPQRIAGNEANWGTTQLSPAVVDGAIDFRVTVEYVDLTGVAREEVLSSASPNATLGVGGNTSLTYAIEELGIHYAAPPTFPTCSLTLPSGPVADVSGFLFDVGQVNTGSVASGQYVFNCSYAGTPYVRTLTLNIGP
jgi:hypothetical protein